MSDASVMSLWISGVRTNLWRRLPLHWDAPACPSGAALTDDGGVIAVVVVALHLASVETVRDLVDEE